MVGGDLLRGPAGYAADGSIRVFVDRMQVRGRLYGAASLRSLTINFARTGNCNVDTRMVRVPMHRQLVHVLGTIAVSASDFA